MNKIAMLFLFRSVTEENGFSKMALNILLSAWLGTFNNGWCLFMKVYFCYAGFAQ